MHQLLDDDEPDDPSIRWDWFVAAVAKEFGVLPTVAEQALLDDTDGMIGKAMTMYRYREAKTAFDGPDLDMKAWRGSQVMKMVKKNTFDLHRRE